LPAGGRLHRGAACNFKAARMNRIENTLFIFQKEKTMRTRIVKPIAFCVAFAALAALAQPTLAGLLVNYEFETTDGTTTPDSSGNNLAGTWKSGGGNTPTIVVPPTSHAGYNPINAMYSPGSSSLSSSNIPRLEVADASSGPLDASFTAFTVAMWLNPGAENTFATKTQCITGKMGKSGNRGWQLIRSPINGAGPDYLLNGFEISLNQTMSDADPALDVVWPDFFSYDTWTHLAMTFTASPDGVTPGSVKIYKDGQLYADVATTLTALNGANSSPFDVGNRGVYSSTPSYRGYIDDYRIYDEALSPTAIGDLAGVPEPGTLILLVAGLIGMVVAYRRRER
jgi:hypothetical protein